MGENRVEQLLAKQAVARERFTWDFIGHLQSRKARDLVGPRAPRALALDALGRRAPRSRAASEPIACLVEVNAAGEESKQGLAPEELDAFLEAVAGLPNMRVEGLMTMPPLAASPEASRPHFAALRELAASLAERWAPQHGFAPALDGHEPGLRGRGGGGGDDRPPRIGPLPPIERIVSPLMGLGDVWYKTKVYFGLAEDDDLYEDDEDGTQAEEDLEQRYRRRPNVRPLDARRGRGEVRVDDIFSEDDASLAGRRRLRDAGGADVGAASLPRPPSPRTCRRST